MEPVRVSEIFLQQASSTEAAQKEASGKIGVNESARERLRSKSWIMILRYVVDLWPDGVVHSGCWAIRTIRSSLLVALWKSK